jgi:hypothetical protein
MNLKICQSRFLDWFVIARRANCFLGQTAMMSARFFCKIVLE